MLQNLLLWKVAYPASKNLIRNGLARGGLMLLALDARPEFRNIPHTPLSWKGWSQMKEAVAPSPPPIWIQHRQLFNLHICLYAGPG